MLFNILKFLFSFHARHTRTKFSLNMMKKDISANLYQFGSAG